MVWTSKKYDIDFMGVPKCGVTTICNSLEIDMDKDWVYFKDWKARRVFTVIRNPYERILSGWRECLRRGTTKATTFSHFVSQIDNEGFFDNHIEPITHYVQYFPRLMDYFILDETLMERLQQYIGFKFEVVTGNISKPYPKNINNLDRSTLERIYSRDFQLYETVKNQFGKI